MNEDMNPSRCWPVSLLVIVLSFSLSGCTREIPTLVSAMQADGWSAQPVMINHRFTSDAQLNTAGIPAGDEGYHLHVLTCANYWDYTNTQTFIKSFVKRPLGHAWLILEGPQSRLECGHSGNYGDLMPRYHEGVIQRIRDGDPDPIAYLWQTMNDGQFESGNPGYDPTYAWRLPITSAAHDRIHDYIMKREYQRFSLSTYNCGEMVTQAAALAGINLGSQTRITFPNHGTVHGHHLRVWTDPKYGSFEIRSIDVLELDLRHLTRMGVGSDVTAAYLAARPYQPRQRVDHPSLLP